MAKNWAFQRLSDKDVKVIVDSWERIKAQPGGIDEHLRKLARRVKEAQNARPDASPGEGD